MINDQPKKPHPHADVLRAIADGRSSEIECRQMSDDAWGSWLKYAIYAFNPLSHADWQWRIKPKTHLVNGIECPAPLRETPQPMSTVYVAAPAVQDLIVVLFWDDENSNHKRWLERGLIHSTMEAGIFNAHAMLAFKDRP